MTDAASTRAAPAVPFTVIGGFLGAGKSTLLNHLLAEWSEERIAVIVNDVGDIPIDTDLIASHDGDTITLTNGCICCSLSDEFAIVLPDLAAADPPWDRIVVEASGISDPGAVAQYGTLPGFRLDGVIVLADAETIRERADDRHLGAQVRHQLQRADVVVVTKTDLVDDETRRAVHSWLDELTGGTVVIDADHGRLPVGLVSGTSRPGTSDTVTRLPDTRHLDTRHPGSPHRDAGHPVDVVTVSTNGVVDRDELSAWIDDLPAGVLRVKGTVVARTALDDAPEQHPEQHRVQHPERPLERLEVHVVGRRRRLVAVGPHRAAQGGTVTDTDTDTGSSTGTGTSSSTGDTTNRGGNVVVIALPGVLDHLRIPTGWSVDHRH